MDESTCDFLVRAFRHSAAKEKAATARMIASASKPFPNNDVFLNRLPRLDILIPKNPLHETNEKLGIVVTQNSENAKTAGQQAHIAMWIAAIGLVATVVGVFFAYQSYTDAKESGEKADAQIKAFQIEIRALTNAQREERAAFVKAISDGQHRASGIAAKK